MFGLKSWLPGGISLCPCSSGNVGSAPTPSGTLSDLTLQRQYRGLDFEVSTDEASGTLYYVILPSGAPAPSEEQIKAGTDGADAAAVHADSTLVGMVGVSTDVPRVLSDSTSYDFYAVQETASFSNVVTDSFVTPSVIAGGAYDGSAGDLSTLGNAAFDLNQADPDQGTNAIALIDDGAGGTGQVIAAFNAIAFADGVNYHTFVFKKAGGTFDAIRLRGLNATTNPITAINVSDGSSTDGATPWDVLDITAGDDDYFIVQFEIDRTGDPDLVGALYIQLLDGGSVTVPRDGTQRLELYQVFVSAEAL